MKDNTKRFSARVDNYTKYRPSYPIEMVDYLIEEFGFSKTSIIADVGSGTGIFTELFLDKVKIMYAVEPNLEMRMESENRLKGKKTFCSVDASAENTTLPHNSVDFIAVTQAFHWFNLEKAKIEFKRVLKNDGYIFLIWNKRVLKTPFQIEYDNILRHSIPEYSSVNHHNITVEIIKNFIDRNYHLEKFINKQIFDWTGIIGRLNSSSYTPRIDSEDNKLIENQIKMAFDQYSLNGKIEFEYETEVYSGKFS